MLAILAAGALVVPWFVPFVFGSRYTEAVPLILTTFPSVLLISLTTVLSQYLASEGFPWGQVFAWAAGLAAQTILSFWLAGLYGAMGVVYALTISGLLVFAVILIEAFRARRRVMAGVR
jgi:O-antigen/teichoic acid export membrane protein